MTPSPRQRGHTGPNGPGIWGCGAAASWADRSMDSLFVEEVAASLVREFLSRKVRGAALTALGSCSIWGVAGGTVWRHPCNLCTFGEGALPLPAAYPRDARCKRHFPGPGELPFPGAISVTVHFPQSGAGPRPSSRASPSRAREPGAWALPIFLKFTKLWEPSRPALPPGSITSPKAYIPLGKNFPPKEIQRAKKNSCQSNPLVLFISGKFNR